MARIEVTPHDDDTFEVVVDSEGRRTTHVVTVTMQAARRLRCAQVDRERLVRESFGFLLEREPAGSILRRFSLEDITRYFPEYPSEIASRLETG